MVRMMRGHTYSLIRNGRQRRYFDFITVHSTEVPVMTKP